MMTVKTIWAKHINLYLIDILPFDIPVNPVFSLPYLDLAWVAIKKFVFTQLLNP